MKNKFEVGQEVWFIARDTCDITTCKIHRVEIVMSSLPSANKITYSNENGFQFSEDILYASKEECIKAWLERQGVEEEILEEIHISQDPVARLERVIKEAELVSVDGMHKVPFRFKDELFEAETIEDDLIYKTEIYLDSIDEIRFEDSQMFVEHGEKEHKLEFFKHSPFSDNIHPEEKESISRFNKKTRSEIEREFIMVTVEDGDIGKYLVIDGNAHTPKTFWKLTVFDTLEEAEAAASLEGESSIRRPIIQIVKD